MARLRVGATGNSSLSCRTPVRRVSARRSHLRVRAQANENPFVKIGSQLVKAGSQLTESLTGTTRVAKKNAVDDNVVFVAGATGRLGARAVKECVRAGFTVRAGVRDLDKGNELIETAKQYNVLTPAELKRINLIQYDLLDRDTIAPAIGNAACVVSAIGAPEDKPFDTSAPKKIDGEAAIALVEEAKSSGVKRFIMVTSLGTTKLGWPASALNLFWGVLYWKKLAEQALIRSGMAYTIIRPGGMERPTDTYKETHNTVLYPRDTQFGGQVSRLQVAELIGACVSNPELSGNKTMEVIASDTIPPQPLEELLDSIEAEISLEEMAAKQAEIADVRNRRGSLAAEAEELEAQLAEAEERKVLAETAFSSARGELQEIRTNASGAQRQAADAERAIGSLEERLTATQRQEAAAKAVLDAQRRAQRSGELLSSADMREITQPILNPPVDGAPEPQAAAGGGLFGGLFGAPKAKPQEVVEEVVEEVQEEVVTKARGGFGGLFAGIGKPAAKEEVVVEEEQEEEAAPEQKKAAAPKKAAGAKKAAAAPKAEEEEEEESTQVVKGGGLFGLFQQDTVYADGGAAEAAPPPPEVVERAITKKGSGRKSVKELLTKKAPDGGDAPAEAPAAPAAKKAAEAKSGGGFFGGMFGGGGAEPEAAEASKAEAPEAPKPAAKETPKPPAPKAAAPKPAPAKAAAAKPAASGGGDLAAKRSAAVAAALSNLGAAADKASDKAGDAKKVVEKAAEEPAKAAKQVAKKVADAAPAALENGATGASASVKEAEAWIAQWQSKQKVASKTRA